LDILVTYDVATDSDNGRQRLRRVAQICKNYGQRVQKSVFECTVSEVQLERLRHRLVSCIDQEEDSLRIYHLPQDAVRKIENYGISKRIDFEGPLVV
jgi:CRISPR-associated protein Cas2